jgi:hypothetical protein
MDGLFAVDRSQKSRIGKQWDALYFSFLLKRTLTDKATTCSLSGATNTPPLLTQSCEGTPLAFTPKPDSVPQRFDESAHSPRGCSARLCGYSCGGATPGFPQILPHSAEEDHGRGAAQFMRRDLSHLKRSAPRSQPQTERPVGKRRP